MTTEKIEQTKLQLSLDSSRYPKNPKDEQKSEHEENYFLKMKAEDEEIKRASQQNNDIYRLMLQAKHGSCKAIKKLINYQFKNFKLASDFANKLTQEASQMLSEQQEIYTTSCGELSENSINAAKEEVSNNNHGEKTDIEMAEEYNNLIADMELL